MNEDENWFHSLAQTLTKISSSNVSIITHSGGDPDSIGAAFVAGNIIAKLSGREPPPITVPEGETSLANSILQHLRANSLEEVGESDYYILIDVGSLGQLGPSASQVAEKGPRVVVIDHHSFVQDNYPKGAQLFIREDYPSTSEIILDLCTSMGYTLSVVEAEALFLGLYYDTARLSIATKQSLLRMCQLTEKGIEPKTLLSEVEAGMDISERIARLKSAERMSLFRVGEWLVALSDVGSYHSSAARSLLHLGAHVSVVAGEDSSQVTLALRSAQDFFQKTGVSLGKDLCPEIASAFSGSGGGHPTAAGARCRGSAQEVLDFTLKLICRLLGEKEKKV